MDSTQGHDAVNTMTQDVFNWMARTVNKDFVQLGYPTILTKKGGRDFVSLCALMQNCSTLLAVVRAKGSMAAVSTIAPDEGTARLSTNVAGAALDPLVSSKLGKSSQHLQHADGHQKKRGGLFSSSKSFKQLQASNADSHAKMNAKAQRLMQFEREEFASVYESIVDSVRKDTEQIISETCCLSTELVLPESAGDQQLQQLSKDQTALYFATRWVQFKETVTQRLLEANRMAIELQALRPFSVQSSINAMTRSKSACVDTGAAAAAAAAAADFGSESCGLGSDSLSCSRRSHHGRSSRQRSQSHVSITKIPSLEAEIRRLKLELNRREQRHKEESDRHAKERERMTRDLRMAQRRSSLGVPRWSSSSSQPVPQQQQHNACDCGDQAAAIPEIMQALDRLTESLGGGVHQSLTSPAIGSLAGSLKSFSKQHQHQAYVDRVCSAILTRVQGLQADCNTSRRRQADLEVLISILKARLDLTNDQLSDVGKFESAVNDIARKMVVCCDTGGGGAAEPQRNTHQQSQLPLLHQGGSSRGASSANLATHGCGDEHRDSLVSRLTSRLRERQRPV